MRSESENLTIGEQLGLLAIMIITASAYHNCGLSVMHGLTTPSVASSLAFLDILKEIYSKLQCDVTILILTSMMVGLIPIWHSQF